MAQVLRPDSGEGAAQGQTQGTVQPGLGPQRPRAHPSPGEQAPGGAEDWSLVGPVFEETE